MQRFRNPPELRDSASNTKTRQVSDKCAGLKGGRAWRGFHLPILWMVAARGRELDRRQGASNNRAGLVGLCICCGKIRYGLACGLTNPSVAGPRPTHRPVARLWTLPQSPINLPVGPAALGIHPVCLLCTASIRSPNSPTLRFRYLVMSPLFIGVR